MQGPRTELHAPMLEDLPQSQQILRAPPDSHGRKTVRVPNARLRNAIQSAWQPEVAHSFVPQARFT